MSPRNHSCPLAESQHHVIDPTNPCGALDDGVEDRLHVGRRAADDAEHLGCCGLMLQASRNSALRSWISLNNRTFSMAITAWSAKVLRSAICFSVNGLTSVRRITIAPIAMPSRNNGMAKYCPQTQSGTAPVLTAGNSVLDCSDVMDMNRLAVDHRSANHGAAIEWTVISGRLHGRGAVSGDNADRHHPRREDAASAAFTQIVPRSQQ